MKCWDRHWINIIFKYTVAETIPNRAYNLNNAIEVKIMLIMKNKNNRKYPNINEGDYVKIFAKGKGNYILRKETRNQWSEKNIK